MGDDFKNIISNFRIYGDFLGARHYGSGHINTTFKITMNQAGTEVAYILQRINTNIFKDPIGLLNNIELVTNHQKKYYSESSESSRNSLTLLKTWENQSYFLDDKGIYWRVYLFISDAVTHQKMKNAKIAFQTGNSFGLFQKSIMDLEPKNLSVTIPNFHNTIKRFDFFEQSVNENKSGRIKDISEEIDFLVHRKNKASLLLDMLKNKEIPERIVHNDTKLNNIMFDKHTDKPVCVIDLDTVMPGVLAYDFGDMVRIGASSAIEDETNLEKVYINYDYFEALLDGYISATKDYITNNEIVSLLYGCYVILYEMALRFLSDHINGDIYFSIHRENHNLDRTRNQIHLLKSLENNWDKMATKVNTYLKREV